MSSGSRFVGVDFLGCLDRKLSGFPGGDAAGNFGDVFEASSL